MLSKESNEPDSLLMEAIRKYISLEGEEEAIIRHLFREKKLRKGDYFLREGDVCRHLAFVEQGLLRYHFNRDGEEITYNFAREKDFVCNYVSFFQKTPSSKNIQATESTILLLVSYEDLQGLYQKLREGEKFGRLLLEKNYVVAILQLSSQYTDSPEKRYLKFLESFPDLQQRLPQYYIASFVGVKPPSLSRIRKRLSVKSL